MSPNRLIKLRRSTFPAISVVTFSVLVIGAIFAPVIATQNPYDLKAIELDLAFTPPIWQTGGQFPFLLGTDEQGRDILSIVLYGSRISLAIGLGAVLLACSLGVALGVVAGYSGGKVDFLLMRLAELQLCFPPLLLALLINSVLYSFLKPARHMELASLILILSIGFADWGQYARTVRGSVLVDKNKDYVLAAQLLGLRSITIIVYELLPNILIPILVIATINVALAVMAEATLSFLGLGLPPTHPSLGTLIRSGYNYLFSGEWWIVTVPGIVLAALGVSVNYIGDWLRGVITADE